MSYLDTCLEQLKESGLLTPDGLALFKRSVEQHMQEDGSTMMNLESTSHGRTAIFLGSGVAYGREYKMLFMDKCRARS